MPGDNVASDLAPPAAQLHRAIAWLESLQRAGVTHVPREVAEGLIAEFPSAPQTKSTPVSTSTVPARANAAPARAPAAGSVSASPPPSAPSPARIPPQRDRSVRSETVVVPFSSDVPSPADRVGARPGAARKSGSSTDASVAVTVSGSSNLLTRAEPWPAPLPVEERPAALAVVAQEVSRCTRCPELVACRTQTVFGVGHVSPRLCFLGEAPGADEDRLGEPFVGRAGQLLNKIIEACTLKREEVYILNILKCRPPENRTPTPEEVANCFPYLERQLAILRPEFICCLGAVAAQNLLQTTQGIGRLRGTIHDYRGIRVVCTYHPAYLLRNPASKKETWDDMQFLMAAMGIELPKKQASGTAGVSQQEAGDMP
ncbi:MAG: uracil-DNA glycosylase [Planctomycetia bacterium]|nr:uracil-DNA glycosylase [Planctomycetia bacterium]